MAATKTIGFGIVGCGYVGLPLAVELGRARAIPDELASLAARANRIASYVASCPGAMPPIPARLAAT